MLPDNLILFQGTGVFPLLLPFVFWAIFGFHGDFIPIQEFMRMSSQITSAHAALSPPGSIGHRSKMFALLANGKQSGDFRRSTGRFPRLFPLSDSPKVFPHTLPHLTHKSTFTHILCFPGRKRNRSIFLQNNIFSAERVPGTLRDSLYPSFPTRAQGQYPALFQNIHFPFP